MNKKLSLGSCVSLLLLTAGCSNADLEAIRAFSRHAQSQQAVFSEIANDFYGSCIRRARRTDLSLDIARGADPLTEEQTAELVNATLAEIPGEATPELQAVTGTQEIQPLSRRRRTAEETCQTNFGRTAEQLKTVHSLMIAYVQKLGDLASGDLTDYSGQFSALQESITNLNASLQSVASASAPVGAPSPTVGFDADAVNSALSIAEFVTTIATRRYQKEELVEVITTSDPDFQKLVQGLINVVEQDYVSVLDREQANLGLYYEGVLEIQLARLGRIEPNQPSAIPLLSILVDSQWRTEVEAVEARQEIATKYVEVLKEIAHAHAELVARFSDGSVDQTKIEETRALLLEQSDRIKTLLLEAEHISKQLAE
jgi:hypothetical protein